MRYAAAAAALVGAALATPLTVLDPCPAAPTKFPEITVTSQFQPVSYCVPTSTCSHGNCTTEYPMSTSTYVSTVIPCAVEGTSASSCTVTKTDQVVPCSEFTTTITSTSAFPTTVVNGNLTKTITMTSSSYETITKEWSAPYNQIGPLGIPGYEGGGICKECAVQSDGGRAQAFSINECHASAGKSQCSQYAYTWYSKPAPSTAAPATAVVSSQAAVTAPGTYTYTFPQVAPATTITSEGATVTVPAQPWFAHVTTSCKGPTTFDFTVTVTKTITYYAPYPQKPEAGATNGGGYEWGTWQFASLTSSAHSADPTNLPEHSATPGSQTGSPHAPATAGSQAWGNWGAPSTSSSTTGAATTTTSVITTTTSGSGKPTGIADLQNFVLSVVANPGQRFRKRAPKYVGFSEDDGTSVDRSGAAIFSYDYQGELTTGGQFIQRQGSGYIPFEKSGTSSGGPSHFFCTAGTSLILPGASFCLAGDSVIISFTSSPSGCVPCNLICEVGDNNTWTTSSTSTVSSTSTYATPTTTSFTVGPTTTLFTSTTTSEDITSTSSTLDVSADVDVPDPTPEPGIKRRGLVRGMRY